MKKPKDINNDDELHGQQNDDKRPQVLGGSVQDVDSGHLNSHCIRDIRDLRTHVHEGSNIYEIVKRSNRIGTQYCRSTFPPFSKFL